METKALNTQFWESVNSPGTGDGGDFTTKASDRELLSSYINNWCVHKIANGNARQVASTPFHLYKITNKGATTTKHFKKLSPRQRKRIKAAQNIGDDMELVEITEHPLLTLLSHQVLNLLQLSLEVFGRAYFYKDHPTQPTSLRFLKPYLVTTTRDGEGNVNGYVYTNIVNGKVAGKTNLTVDEVVAFRNVSLSDPYGGGTSWLRSVFEQVSVSEKWMEYQEWLLDNRARPDFLISPKSEDANGTELTRLEKDITDRTKGKNNGKPISTTAAVTITPLQFPPTDLAPLAFNDQMIKAVANAADYPLALLDKDANRANYDGSVYHWKDTAIKLRLQSLECSINEHLTTSYGETLTLEFDNPVPEDKEFALKEQEADDKAFLEEAKLNVYTRNEIRERRGYDPIPGGDEIAAVSAAPETPVPEPVDETPAPVVEPKAISFDALLKINEAVAKGYLDRATAINQVSTIYSFDQATAKNLVTHPPAKKKKTAPKLPHIEPSSAAEKKLADVMRSFYAKVMKHWLGQIGEKSAEATITKSEDPGMFGLPDRFVPIDEWTEDLAHDVKPVIELQMKEIADGRVRALGRVGASPDVFSVLPAEINKAVDKASLRLAQSTLDTTEKNANDALRQLRETIRDGLFEGNSVQDVSDEIGRIFEGATELQTDRIAQTEISRAVHEGQRIAAKASGIVKGFKLLKSSDACPLCDEIEKENPTVGLDEKFNADDTYDDSVLPIHVGCRCTMTEIIDLGEGDDESESE